MKNEKKYERYARPVAMNMVEENGKIWMCLLNRNGICEIDKKSRIARICHVFKGEPLSKKLLYFNVDKVKDNLIFSPYEADNIAIYNLSQDSITYIPLKPLKHDDTQNRYPPKFWNIFHIHSSVYILGWSYPAIIKINLKLMVVEYITDWLDEIEVNSNPEEAKEYFSDGYVISENLVFIPIGCMNAVLELNLDTSHTKIRKLEVSVNGIAGISSSDGINIWLVGKKSKTNRVCCWNRLTNKIKEYFLPDIGENIFSPFYAPICTDSKVFLMPVADTPIFEINIQIEEIRISAVLEERSNSMSVPLWPWWKTISSRLQNPWLTYLTCNDLCWHEYNVVTGERKNYFVYFESEEIEKYFEAVYLEAKEKNIILSEDAMSLGYYINKLQEETEFNIKIEKHWIGEEIYKRIC